MCLLFCLATSQHTTWCSTTICFSMHVVSHSSTVPGVEPPPAPVKQPPVKQPPVKEAPVKQPPLVPVSKGTTGKALVSKAMPSSVADVLTRVASPRAKTPPVIRGSVGAMLHLFQQQGGKVHRGGQDRGSVKPGPWPMSYPPVPGKASSSVASSSVAAPFLAPESPVAKASGGSGGPFLDPEGSPVSVEEVVFFDQGGALAFNLFVHNIFCEYWMINDSIIRYE